MKKTLMLATCVALAAILALPASALGRPGKGKGNGRAGGVSMASTGTPAPWASHGKGNGGRGGRWSVTATGTAKPGRRLGRLGVTRTPEASESVIPSRSVLSSGAAGGIGNALTSIQANIAKAQAKVAAGTKKRVPPGLLRVLAKFMAWLGLGSPAPSTSLVPTSTPTPTGTVSPTSTPIPTGTPTP